MTLAINMHKKTFIFMKCVMIMKCVLSVSCTPLHVQCNRLTQSVGDGLFRLTSGIPEPQAYGANTFTRDTARKAKDSAQNVNMK